jgi:hypothetical protein
MHVERVQKFSEKIFWGVWGTPYLCTPKLGNGALVKRLRRLPFTEE